MVAFAAVMLAAGCARHPEKVLARRQLRVCADPNHLPYSNERGEGFENKIAELVARDLNADLQYTWWAQRRGFVRNTLKAGECDLLIGVPSGFEMAATTAPYYRSTYVFVTRRDRGLRIRSFDDPALRKLRIGVHLIGDSMAAAPPVHALTRRGLAGQIVGIPLQGDYSQPNPPARLIEAVAKGDVDVAVAWGPLAGYFATRESVPLEITPVEPQVDPPEVRFTFAIGMGVRRGSQELKKELEAVLNRRQSEIRQVLQSYGVPLVALEGSSHESEGHLDRTATTGSLQ